MIEQQRATPRRASTYGSLPLHPHAPPFVPRTYPTVSPHIPPYKPPHITRPIPTTISASPLLPAQSIARPATSAPSAAATVGMSYHRPLSPGGRRIQNPARASDSFADPYYTQRHNSYTSPRTSTGVVPISSQTFVSSVASQPSREHQRPAERYDAYSGRPRRSSLIDTQRGAPATQVPTRSRPTVVQNDIGRPSSPLKATTTKDYYITPASSVKEHRKTEHKKLYSVDAGTAKLVADVDVPVDKHHRRRESVERGAYRGLASEKERDRGRRDYHANGTSKLKCPRSKPMLSMSRTA